MPKKSTEWSKSLSLKKKFLSMNNLPLRIMDTGILSIYLLSQPAIDTTLQESETHMIERLDQFRYLTENIN